MPILSNSIIIGRRFWVIGMHWICCKIMSEQTAKSRDSIPINLRQSSTGWRIRILIWDLISRIFSRRRRINILANTLEWARCSIIRIGLGRRRMCRRRRCSKMWCKGELRRPTKRAKAWHQTLLERSNKMKINSRKTNNWMASRAKVISNLLIAWIISIRTTATWAAASVSRQACICSSRKRRIRELSRRRRRCENYRRRKIMLVKGLAHLINNKLCSRRIRRRHRITLWIIVWVGRSHRIWLSKCITINTRRRSRLIRRRPRRLGRTCSRAPTTWTFHEKRQRPVQIMLAFIRTRNRI